MTKKDVNDISDFQLVFFHSKLQNVAVQQVMIFCLEG